MPSTMQQKEFEEMITRKLGPSMTDLAYQEGQIESHRDILKAYLTRRFGSLPEALQQRIDSMSDVAQLRQAQERAWDCQSLDELQL